MSCVCAPVMSSRAETCGCHRGHTKTTPAVAAFNAIAVQPSVRPSRVGRRSVAAVGGIEPTRGRAPVARGDSDVPTRERHAVLAHN